MFAISGCTVTPRLDSGRVTVGVVVDDERDTRSRAKEWSCNLYEPWSTLCDGFFVLTGKPEGVERWGFNNREKQG